MMIERLYDYVVSIVFQINRLIFPYYRRVIRFLALPYCYYFLVNWKTCKVPKVQVIKDLLYIFFTLKYFPDNYSQCRLWEKNRDEWVYYYGSIYDPYQRMRLRRKVQPKEYSILYEDKSVCNYLCQACNINVPRYLGRIDCDSDYKSHILNLFQNNQSLKIIIKPLRGIGGDDIYLIYQEDAKVVVRGIEKEYYLENWNLKEESIIQEFVSQNLSISKFSNSINTIRIVTLLTSNDQVLIVGALMRFGFKGNFIDNTSKGGIGVGINLEAGTLKSKGFDKENNEYYYHPDSKILFEDFKIPFWDEVVEFSKSVQKKLCYSRLLGLDIAIGKNCPILIEINDNYDNVGLEQKCGPILKNEKVANEFYKYDLLVNKYQKKLNCSHDSVQMMPPSQG